MSEDTDIYPKLNIVPGTVHPINQTKEYILDILSSIGFNNISSANVNVKNC